MDPALLRQLRDALHAALDSPDVHDVRAPLATLVLAEVATGRMPAFSELSRFPEVRRDLAILVATEVAADDVLRCIREAQQEKDPTVWVRKIKTCQRQLLKEAADAQP